MYKSEVIVFGGGIIGVSIAVHLILRGISVVLVDRDEPGQGASFGNAGLIQTEAVLPKKFPQHITEILKYATNSSNESYYRIKTLPSLAVPFAKFWYHSHAERYHRISEHYAALIERSLPEHLFLAELTGAQHYLANNGWLQLHDNDSDFFNARNDAAHRASRFRMTYSVLSSSEAMELEPALQQKFGGVIHWTQPYSVSNPFGVLTHYLNYFKNAGGIYVHGNLSGLKKSSGGWSYTHETGVISSDRIVFALGGGSNEALRIMGKNVPLFVKRGYHMHYSSPGNLPLIHHAMLNATGGFVLAPMEKGIRLTTGAEFCRLGDNTNSIQLIRSEKMARKMLPELGKSIDNTAWHGYRPCIADMLPVIGPDTNDNSVYYAFGHCHQGFTMGPLTGRLIADLITQRDSSFDLKPYSISRFG
ncbi:NAD(P)/FAD-dependent oxidoreductase [Acidithiobacillus thiooxidans]|uniref:D-amino acid dehydrogenase n=1 Tax=Acidithiobacillus thiooxidans ATCC 19377 TaxID=637390 RepID=A0A543PZZ9_ACITH|nr:FAD-binding oxidoreductase [Acidithiobacillus thiooxidans]MDX5936351.1 FAD-binding oxidoreductase [Acidithiobacillus thiooxidans]TQN49648.1 D-amino acid dehydrogenase [Acidithiobacillus thiooxidans ATCC 19377]